MKSEYETDDKLNKWFGKMVALALVTPNKVEEAFVNLLDATPDYDQLQISNDYVTENYIHTNLYPISLWNQYDREKRTNNDLEGFNSKINKFLRNHPYICLLIRKIQSEESCPSLKYLKVEKQILKQKGRNKG